MRTRLAISIGLALVAALALTAAPAQAQQTHLFREALGSAEQPSFENPSTLTLEQSSGDVYVIDLGGPGVAPTIRRYHADGTPSPFSALGTNVIDGARGPGGLPCAEEAASCDENPENGFVISEVKTLGGPGAVQLAIDESGGIADGNIYVAQYFAKLVGIFAADGSYLGQLTRAGTKVLGEPKGVAVDGSGNVYVSEFARKQVDKFVPSANPPVNTDGAALFSTGEGNGPDGLALGTGPTAGKIFVVRQAGSTESSLGAILRFDLATKTLDYAVADELDRTEHESVTGLAVDPTTGHLFATGGERQALDEFDVSGGSSATLLSSVKEGNFPWQYPDAVAIEGTSGDIYSAYEREVRIYDPEIVTQPNFPTVSAATGITPSKATLHGEVNADGEQLTGCLFEYGVKPVTGTVTFEASVPCEGPLPSDGADHPVSATLTGLPPSEGYEFRLAVENANEAPVHGAKQYFSTAAIAKTQTASEISGSGATLNGLVNPDGTAVSECFFEYGTDSEYGETIPCAESGAEIGEGEEAVPVHADITGLEPKTTYHFRLVAANGNGTQQSYNSQFKTLDTFTVETGAASGVTNAAATLNGTVNPGGTAFEECLFEYVALSAYEPTSTDPYVNAETVPCAESGAEIGAGEEAVPVHADIAGLEVGSEYRFRLVGVHPLGTTEGAGASFSTLGPLVEAQWAQSVGASEAVLRAEVNPRGTPTTWHLEYGRAGGPYEHVTAESESIGSDDAAHLLSVPLAGLEAGAGYHYRFVAANRCLGPEPAEACVSAGPDLSFTAYPPALARKADCANQALRVFSSAALPDCRAYEMVSPVDKGGADIRQRICLCSNREARLMQAAPSGERLTYTSYRSFGDAEGAPPVSTYLATRKAGEGWGNESLNPPQEGPDLFSAITTPLYKAFSEDLCQGWLVKGTEPLLAPGAVGGQVNLYRHDNCGEGGYEALTTVEPYRESEVPAFDYVPRIEGFSADGSLSAFVASGRLTDDASEELQAYVAEGGALHLVCYLPDGTPYDEQCEVGAFSAARNVINFDGSVDNAVSADGSRVYWTGVRIGPGEGVLYLRENPEQPQSAVAGEECTEAGKACTLEVAPKGFFLGATPDGGRALYKRGTLYNGAADLYEFDAAEASSTRIAGKVWGVMGTSEDMGRVYLGSGEVLAGPNARGESPLPGGRNLYLYEEGAGFAFITTLPEADEKTPGGLRQMHPYPYFRRARVSADGLHAVFMSEGRPTGYDNTDRYTGEAAAEVFLYEAPSGRLRCVSCDPSGARPVGGIESLYHPNWVAARIPGWEYDLHATRPLAEDGQRVFFDSWGPLVPADANGAPDVYEWQAGESQEDCEAVGAELFLAREGGCLSLISSGEGAADSFFVDASADGRDVFFTTGSSLAPQDPGLIDIYDAREGGGFPPPQAPPASCAGEACQSSPTPPDDPTPASESFLGAGNVVPAPAVKSSRRCAKGKVKRRGRCVRRHKKTRRCAKGKVKRKGKCVRKRRAKHNRRAGR